MSAPVWSQLDAGVALVSGAILTTASIRKLQRPEVFARTLQQLDPAWSGRRSLTLRIAIAIGIYESVVGVGVVVFRGALGFPFACALLVACVVFLVALARAVQQSVPCACFGRLGKTAAGGREIGRAFVLVAAASFLVGHRALDARAAYGIGPYALGAAVVTLTAIVAAQWIGGRVRPGVAPAPDTAGGRASLAEAVRTIAGYDSDIYSTKA
jgi:hypothetical protein